MTIYYQGTVDTGANIMGELYDFGDYDEYGVQLISGLTYRFEERGSWTGEGTLDDPHLYLIDQNGFYLADNDDANLSTLNSLISYRANYTGWHYLDAGAFLDSYIGSYRLFASEGLGTSGADYVVGTSSVDSINAAGGNDTVLGGNGNDWIKGFDGNDLLRGQNNNDVLTGGAGADVLIGGVGADRFNFEGTAGSTPSFRDIIRAGDGATAFQGAGAASGDRIDVHGVDANAVSGGNQDFVFGGTGRGHLWLTESGASTLVNGNTDNDVAIEFQLVIEDSGVRASAYTAADFVL